jgi:RNA polymerase sigma-70 factor (ECF subfamily)
MGLFQTTRWSLILKTRDANARHALEELCRSYRAPVLTYVRHWGAPAADAEDLTQSFFERLLTHRAYEQADPARGSFRAFLLTALRRFLINAEAFNRAAKRRGNSETVPLFESDGVIGDVTPDAMANDESPEAAFDRAFALAVLRRAIAQLGAEAARAGKADQFATLRDFLSNEPGAADYVELALRLGMRANTVAVTVHRLRQRLRTLVRSELDDTADNAQTAAAEYAHLRLALAKAVPEK